MNEGTAPTLRLIYDFDERTAWEVEQKGWFEGALAVLPNGLEIALSFWDPVRLAQEISDGARSGRVCFAEPGLVIIPSVTREHMQKAIEELARVNYFDRLIALTQSRSK
jgi:hypothetical protein